MKMVSWNHIYELSVRTVPKFSFSSHFNNIRSFKFIFQVLCDILGEGHTRVFIQLVSFSIFSRCPLYVLRVVKLIHQRPMILEGIVVGSLNQDLWFHTRQALCHPAMVQAVLCSAACINWNVIF